ncbi:MAG: tetratricopeptide repeat protein [Kofleriaceae bacterium]
MADEETAPAAPQIGGIKKKTLITIAIVTIVVWAFAVQTGSTALLIVVGVLTALLIGVITWALFMLRKQRGLMGVLQGAAASPEARREALAKLDAQKDANSPVNVFARSQLLAADDPKGALKLLESVDNSKWQAAMQDDVALLKAQLYLGTGQTQNARKCADTINLDNPDRKEIRPMAAAIVSEAWARTGKPKEALALVDTIELPKKDGDQIATQIKVVKVFAKFAANQRGPARVELKALADQDVNNLSRFLAPQFKVHPELQKLARSVLEQHPQARAQAKQQAKSQKQR